MQVLTSERSSVLLQNIWSASKNLDEFRVALKEEKPWKNYCNCSDRNMMVSIRL